MVKEKNVISFKKKIKNKIFFFCLFNTLLILISDIILKQWIIAHFKIKNYILIIKTYINIIYIYNNDVYLRFFKLTSIYLKLILLIIIIIFFIFNYYDIYLSKLLILSNLLLISGIISNLLDYILYNGIIDFIYFNLFNYNVTIFNISDIEIFFGTILFIIKVFNLK